jgi:hypothetical protein
MFSVYLTQCSSQEARERQPVSPVIMTPAQSSFTGSIQSMMAWVSHKGCLKSNECGFTSRFVIIVRG